MSLGAQQAGIRVDLAVESNPHATHTYKMNQPQTTVFGDDIRHLTSRWLAPWKGIRDALVVFGGPPCQGFSWSNVRTRNLENASNWLFEEFLRVVRELRPAWVVFENVRGITSTAGGLFLEQVSNRLAEDYSVKAQVLNAMHYGVPQNRARFFLVGSRDGKSFVFPPKLAMKPPTVDDAIRDLPTLPNGAAVCCRPYGQASPSHYGRKMRARSSTCCNHLVTQNSAAVVQRYKHVPQGGNWESIPLPMMSNYRDLSRCHTGIYHRLKWTQPSIVIGNFRKNMLIHPSQDRGLSVREAARIQSFPDRYTFYGTIGFQQQQVGDAVPPLLAKSVFRAVRRSAEQ